MHEQIMAERNARAQNRIVAAAQKISQALSLDAVDNLTPRGNDAQVAQLLQREAVADLLDRIANKLVVPAQVTGTVQDAPAPSPEAQAKAEAESVMREQGTRTVVNEPGKKKK